MAIKVAVCGIGNTLRGDDGVGPFVIKELKATVRSKDVLLLDCGSAPENFTDVVERHGPDIVIIVDAVEMGGEPGDTRLVDASDAKDLMLSTHKLPVTMFMSFLHGGLKPEIAFIGVQPEGAGFGKKMSRACMESGKRVASLISGSLKQNSRGSVLDSLSRAIRRFTSSSS